MENNEKKTFSVIVPAYNVEELVKDSLGSVLNQTYKNYELIVVDDCSTDNTMNVISEIAKNNPNVKVYQTPQNMRQGGARNLGLSHANGEYILFLDSDDALFSNNVLEKLNTIIESKHPDLIYTGFKATGCRDFEVMPTEENCNREYRLGEWKWVNCYTLCLRNDVIKENNITFPEGIRYEDVAFNFHAISKCKSYEIAPFFSHWYIARPDSSMGNKQFGQVRDTVSLIEALCDLKEHIAPNDLPLLYRRIAQQESRIIPRLDRVLTKLDCKEKETEEEVR